MGNQRRGCYPKRKNEPEKIAISPKIRSNKRKQQTTGEEEKKRRIKSGRE